MMSASSLSAQIRAKKKQMMEEHSDAVKLSGIPEDATDAEVIKGHEEGERLSENVPVMRDESPSLEEGVMADSNSEIPMEKWEDAKQINQPEDGPVEDRKMKIRKMLSKMGK